MRAFAEILTHIREILLYSLNDNYSKKKKNYEIGVDIDFTNYVNCIKYEQLKISFLFILNKNLFRRL